MRACVEPVECLEFSTLVQVFRVLVLALGPQRLVFAQLGVLAVHFMHAAHFATFEHEPAQLSAIGEVWALHQDLQPLALHLFVHVVAVVHNAAEHEWARQCLLDRLEDANLGESPA